MSNTTAPYGPVDPNAPFPQAPQPKKSHKLRNLLIGGAALMALVGGCSAAMASGGSDTTADAKPSAGVSSEAPAKPKADQPKATEEIDEWSADYLEGSGQAMIDKTGGKKQADTSKRSANYRAGYAKGWAETDAPAEAAPAPKSTKPTMTKSQEQAIGTAKDYLEYTHFSKSGLIKQLKFEEYSAKDAKFAVNHIKVNWNEQAAGAAEDYLDTTHFSRSGLIKQLEFEGYSQTQAEYGVKKAGL
jgi:hypothetical protein